MEETGKLKRKPLNWINNHYLHMVRNETWAASVTSKGHLSALARLKTRKRVKVVSAICFRKNYFTAFATFVNLDQPAYIHTI